MEYKHVQVKDRENIMFYSFDLDLDPMTLVLKLDLDWSRCICIPKIKFLAIAVQNL